jgi:hypothetical protein
MILSSWEAVRVIRDLDVGDFVYLTENRKIETYMVVDEPSKRWRRYKLQSLDGTRTVQLKLDPDNPLWRYVFTDVIEASFDVRRQEQEMEAEIQRRANQWADQNSNTPERLIRCLYSAWQSLSFSTAQFEFRFPDSDMPEVQIARDAMKQIVIERIREYFGVDVESDSDEETVTKEKVE